MTPENAAPNGRKRYCRTCARDKRRAASLDYWRRQQTARSPIAPVPAPPSEAPRGLFDGIAVAVAERARAYRPVRFSETVERGLAERRARAASVRRGSVTAGQVIAAVAETFDLTTADLLGPSREPEVSRSRQLCMFLLREFCPGSGDGGGLSTKQIGRILRREHTTIMYGLAKIDRLVAAGDRDVLRDLDLVRETLGELA